MVVVRSKRALEFACHSKACAPPPAGKGGSSGGSGGGMLSHGEKVAHYEKSLNDLMGRKGVKAQTSRNKLRARIAELKAEGEAASSGGGTGFSSVGKKMVDKYQSRPSDLEPGDVVRFKNPKSTDPGSQKAGSPRLVVDRVERKPYSATVHYTNGDKQTHYNSDRHEVEVEVWRDVD